MNYKIIIKDPELKFTINPETLTLFTSNIISIDILDEQGNIIFSIQNETESSSDLLTP